LLIFNTYFFRAKIWCPLKLTKLLRLWARMTIFCRGYIGVFLFRTLYGNRRSKSCRFKAAATSNLSSSSWCIMHKRHKRQSYLACDVVNVIPRSNSLFASRYVNVIIFSSELLFVFFSPRRPSVSHITSANRIDDWFLYWDKSDELYRGNQKLPVVPEISNLNATGAFEHHMATFGAT